MLEIPFARLAAFLIFYILFYEPNSSVTDLILLISFWMVTHSIFIIRYTFFRNLSNFRAIQFLYYASPNSALSDGHIMSCILKPAYRLSVLVVSLSGACHHHCFSVFLSKILEQHVYCGYFIKKTYKIMGS